MASPSFNRIISVSAFITMLSLGTVSHGEDEFPFPQLQTQAFCKNSVAKMLDKNEQAIELVKCLDQEVFLKARLEPWWGFVDRKIRRQILATYYKDWKFHTYITIASYVGSAIGRACLEGRIQCQNPNGP